MLTVNREGHVLDPRIQLAICPRLEHGTMLYVRGIIVHQTDSPTAQATLNAYRHQPNGAHFLIDRDGSVIQTASIRQRAWHTGPLKARCIAELRCAPREASRIGKMSPRQIDRHEMQKSVPDRYPSNFESLGIELVGLAYPLGEKNSKRKVFENVHTLQNMSLRWLVQELSLTCGIPVSEVFRHPLVSEKNLTEASTAQW